MGMDGTGLSVADALALGKDNDGMFGDGGGAFLWVFSCFFSWRGAVMASVEMEQHKEY